MKYTFTLTDLARPKEDGKTAREKIVLESRTGESARHIALKILAYVLFKDAAGGLPLRIEQGVGQRHKPDLVAVEKETGAVRLWIDCGQIETKRLGRIAAQNTRARIVVVKATVGEARSYARAAARFLPTDPERRVLVSFLGFGEDFLANFLAELRGANEFAYIAETSDLNVTLNGAALFTTLDRFIVEQHDR